MRVLELERMAALEAAAAARAEVSQLKEEQKRLRWQSQLLEKMSEVCGHSGSRLTSVKSHLYMFSVQGVQQGHANNPDFMDDCQQFVGQRRIPVC